MQWPVRLGKTGAGSIVTISDSRDASSAAEWSLIKVLSLDVSDPILLLGIKHSWRL